MRLIDADRLKLVFEKNVVSADIFNSLIDEQPTVDAIPIEFIEEFIQGIFQTRDKHIQETSQWRYFDDNIVVLDALLDSWKEEQEKQNERK